jgi:nitroreductase
MHDPSKSAETYIAEILNIPKKLKIEAMVAVGYPDEEKAPRPKEDLQYSKVHQNLYGKPFKP